MKLRPQVQLRFRDEGQWELCRLAAEKSGVSLNEWILCRLEESYGLGKVEGVEPPSGVPRVRSGVRDDTGDKGKSRGSGTRTIQRPSNRASADRGAVDGGVPTDTSRPGVCERPHVTPHAKTCGCPQCKAAGKKF
jgi:hypothetical protein